MTLARWLPHPNVRLLVLVGFLGGYTTFSTFSYDSLTLWDRGAIGLSLMNMLGSVIAGFLAAALGLGLARALILPAPERSTRAVPQVQAREEGPSAVDAPEPLREDRP
jgi:fluoride exporter